MKRAWILLLLALPLSARGTEAWSWARYTPILARRPFTVSAPAGVVETGADEVVTVVKPPAFVMGIRPCSFVETDRGLRVGFVDNRAKPPEVYTLFVGEEREGVVLVDADFEGEEALLRKGNEQYWLGANEGPGDAAGVAARPEMREAKPMTLSFSERRQLRLAELKRRAEARREADRARESDLSADELERRLQAYQMELLREGKAPLPMVPLTPEMDDQLVAEGVLPPQE